MTNKKIKILYNIALIFALLFLVFAFTTIYLDLFTMASKIKTILFCITLSFMLLSLPFWVLAKIYRSTDKKEKGEIKWK